MPSRTRIAQTYIDLRSINLGAELIREQVLKAKQEYPIRILGDPGEPVIEARGTLNSSNALSGLSALYRNYALQVGDEIEVSYDGSHICIKPPAARKLPRPNHPPPAVMPPGVPAAHASEIAETIFARQRLRYMHIEPFAEKNFREWLPRTEPDVYLAFGAIAEFTDYEYCCGASAELLSNLGYRAETKPDAIMIDRASREYLVAEFKINSSDFRLNHLRDDVDLLICWQDDEEQRENLPPKVIALSPLIEKAIREGEIEL